MGIHTVLWVPLGLKQSHEWESEYQESDTDSKDESPAYTSSATSALSSSRTTLETLIIPPTSTTSAGSNQQTGNSTAPSEVTQSPVSSDKSGQSFPVAVGGFLIAISIILSVGLVIVILLFRRQRQNKLPDEKPPPAVSTSTWSSIWGSRTPNAAHIDASQGSSFKRETAFTSYSLPVGAEAANYVAKVSYQPPIPLPLSHPPFVSRFSGTTQTSASVVEPGSDPFRDFHPVRGGSTRFSRIDPKNRT